MNPRQGDGYGHRDDAGEPRAERGQCLKQRHVARLAGVPKEVLGRAKVILGNPEESELTPEGTVRQSPRRQQDRDKLNQLTPPPQMNMFG